MGNLNSRIMRIENYRQARQEGFTVSTKSAESCYGN